MNYRFILRQLVNAKKQASIFILCVALSMMTLVAISGFGDSVYLALLRDARELQAGDIIVRSSYALEPPIENTINELVAQGDVERARIYEFYSVVRVLTEDNSLLADLKVVEPGYPFYGEVELASGRPFGEVLQPGDIIVAPDLLERLGLQIGDMLNVGQRQLTIQDTVLFEPDRPVDFFALGPRIFIAEADSESLDLIKLGSRVDYITLLKVPDEGNLDRFAAQLEEVAQPRLERIETYKTAESQVQRFLDNFLLFLTLIGIFTLLLAGIGIQSSLTAFLKEREKTIAIIKTVGATSGFVARHYLLAAGIMGFLGTLLGIFMGFVMQFLFPIVLGPFLPPQIELLISSRAIAESLLLGAFVVGVFTFLPIYQLQELRPTFILQKEVIPIQKGPPFILAVLTIFLFFVGMVFWQLQNTRLGIYFIGGVIGLLLLTALLTEGALFFLRRRQLKALAARQALRGLFRPRNATRAIIITLSASLTVIFTIYLLESNLNASFVDAYPDDAPNLLFLDIQPDQREAFAELLGQEVEFVPIVRARISAVNGEVIDPEVERQRDGDNLARTFSLTYRDELWEQEDLIVGESIFNPAIEGVQVSVLDMVLEMRELNIGDVLSFDIQGIPLDATITSFRRDTEDGVGLFFYFVMPFDVLKDAPQTIVTTLKVPPEEIPAIQNKMVAAFPNITVINASETIATFADTMGQLTLAIRFFMIFSIFAGVLIIISSVLATRLTRIQEAVYFKVVGATRRFVLEVFALENVFLGLVSALLALFMSHIASWLITTELFELDYTPFLGSSILLLTSTVLLVVTVGLLASVPILRQKPITFLREQTVE